MQKNTHRSKIDELIEALFQTMDVWTKYAWDNVEDS